MFFVKCEGFAEIGFGGGKLTLHQLDAPKVPVHEADMGCLRSSELHKLPPAFLNLTFTQLFGELLDRRIPLPRFRVKRLLEALAQRSDFKRQADGQAYRGEASSVRRLKKIRAASPAPASPNVTLPARSPRSPVLSVARRQCGRGTGAGVPPEDVGGGCKAGIVGDEILSEIKGGLAVGRGAPSSRFSIENHISRGIESVACVFEPRLGSKRKKSIENPALLFDRGVGLA